MNNWVRRLLMNTREDVWLLLCLLGLVLLVSLMQAVKPWPFKIAIDYVLHGKSQGAALNWLYALPGGAEPKGQLLLLGIASVLIFVIAQSLVVLSTWLGTWIGNRMSLRLASWLFSHLLQQGQGFHRANFRGDMVNRVTQDSRCARILVVDVGLALFTSLVTILSIGIVAWQLDAMMTLASLALIVPVYFLTRALAPRMTEHAYKQAEQEGMLYSQAERTLSSIPMIQACSMEHQEQKQFVETATRSRYAYLRLIRSQLQFNIGVAGITAISVAVITVWSSHRVLQGQMTVGDLWVFLSYLTTICGSITTLAYLGTGWAEGKAKARRVFELMDQDTSAQEVNESERLKLPTTGPLGVWFTEVRVGYEPGHPILKQISLRIEPGEMLALVGQSGAGKSTLVSLIGRMLEPWEGQVCLGSVNTARVGLRELRQRVAWLAQQPYLLPISIADNIAFGQPDASREAIEFAAHRANADDFIRKLPNGYETVLGENAATLSGGQAQRIALARALLLDAGVIILDEPTASVDAETEQSIADQIRLLKGQKTVIVIAHRLSTIRSADRIAVLKDGLIVELGSHTELVEQGGYYSRLMQSQLFHDPPAAPKSDSNHDLPHA